MIRGLIRSICGKGITMPGVSPRRFWMGLAGSAAAFLLAGLMVWAATGWDAEEEGPAPIRVATRPREPAADADHSWSRRRIYDAFPPLLQFATVTAREAGSAIADDEFVVGVEVRGEARAYPLNMLGHPGSEVVNDAIGGVPVAVTFCGLCETPLVFSRRLDDKTLTFYVSGVVVESNMLIRDVETRSGWIQVLGRAVDGPLEGKELQQFPAVWTDWKSWRTAHPGTTAILLRRGSRKYSNTAIGITSSRQRVFEALQWGLARDGKARSWPFSRLARRTVVNDTFAGIPLLIAFDPETLSPTGFDRRLDGGEALTFARRGTELVDETTGSVWDPVTGRALRGPLAGRRLSLVAGTIATTATWRAFHPDSEVWDSGEPPEGDHPRSAL
jgi:Protein of unknown function (DUF3179)